MHAKLLPWTPPHQDTQGIHACYRAFNTQHSETGPCGLQKYQGYLCRDEMYNRTLCITPQHHYKMEVEVAKVVARLNGTECYQFVKSSACEFYFGLLQIEASTCSNWCENMNSTSRAFVPATLKCDGEDILIF